MSDVKRYDWNTGDETPKGEFVMHKHYAALQAENARLKQDHASVVAQLESLHALLDVNDDHLTKCQQQLAAAQQELREAKRALYCHVADAIGRESEERILRECSMCESAAAMQLAREKEVR